MTSTQSLNRAAVAATLALAGVAIYLIVNGFIGFLYGPTGRVLLEVPMFFGMLIALGLFTWLRRGHGFKGLLPGDRDRFTPRLIRGMVVYVLSTVAAVCFVIMLAAGAINGSPDHLPVLAPRSEYVLINHNVATYVTRQQYVVIGVCFAIGWHAGVLALVLSVLHLVLYGGLGSAVGAERV